MQVVNRIGWVIHGLDALMYPIEQVGTPLSFRPGLCLWRPVFVAQGRVMVWNSKGNVHLIQVEGCNYRLLLFED